MPLDKFRKQIDEIDKKIVTSINKRAEIVKKIGEVKHRSKTPFYIPGRESQVYEKVCAHNKGPFPDSAIRAIYREIMSGSLALEKKLSIAYLGPEGSFSHIAAKNKFGESVDYIPYNDIPSVFKAIAKSHSDYGIVPIENSTEGGVNDTIDMFRSTHNKVTAEIYQHITHHLVSKYQKDRIHKIYSKLTVFGQCKNWIASNFPNAELIETVSTTRAAEIASKEKNCAAISSAMCAEIYKLRKLYSSIEDNEHNVTRFFILGKEIPPKTKKRKYRTSLMIGLKDKIGALHDMLIPFKIHNVNLTRIESRPSKKKVWEYFFFLDFEGYYKDRNPGKCLEALHKVSKEIEILGSYPQADTIYG